MNIIKNILDTRQSPEGILFVSCFGYHILAYSLEANTINVVAFYFTNFSVDFLL